MLSDRPIHAPSGYHLEKFSLTGNPVPGDGLVTLIREDMPHIAVVLNTNLQALAYRIGTNRPTTICNIYLNPNQHFTVHELTTLIDQLPEPFLLLGDFNCKSPLWGNTTTDRGGQLIEDLLVAADVCILNTGDPTHFHHQSGLSSAIDLTLCSPQLLPNIEWTVLADAYGSDHFPIILNDVDNNPVSKEPRFILHKANWKIFYDETALDFDEEMTHDMTVDDLVDVLNDTIMSAANRSIPMSSDRIMPRRVSWWTPECTVVNVERKRTLRRYQRSRCVADKISYSRSRGAARFSKNNIRRGSWRSFVSTINIDTPMSKIWSRYGKMCGK
jgi:hypothetical protein